MRWQVLPILSYTKVPFAHLYSLVPHCTLQYRAQYSAVLHCNLKFTSHNSAVLCCTLRNCNQLHCTLLYCSSLQRTFLPLYCTVYLTCTSRLDICITSSRHGRAGLLLHTGRGYRYEAGTLQAHRCSVQCAVQYSVQYSTVCSTVQ